MVGKQGGDKRGEENARDQVVNALEYPTKDMKEISFYM